MNNQKIEEIFVDTVGELATNLGLNRIVGQIYAQLYLSEEPLSLDTLAEKLKVSKGNISINIRELERWDAVRRVYIRGDRKDYYEVNPDFLNIVYKRLKLRAQRILDEFSTNIFKIEEKNSNKNLKSKLKDIKEIYTILQTIMKIVPEEISLEKLKKGISLLNNFKGFLGRKNEKRNPTDNRKCKRNHTLFR